MPADPNLAEAIARAALFAPPADRAAYLDAACGGDADLRAAVSGALQAASTADPDAPAPVDTTVGLPAGRAAAPANLVGAVLADRYTIRNLLGEGGMGAVYLAEQARPVRRRVAVKMIKAGGDSARVVARFGAERQALALLDHPHIAKVFDAGTTPWGTPFFVMELADGVPLTEFCDNLRLSIADRLAVFAKVCQAVQHAHQKGIIHRDLKPGNILVAEVDGVPAPKVIDFGLAKAVAATPEADGPDRTLAGAILGTPLYMAPEQAGGDPYDVDTRADVYALGVILYELLTGTTPLDRAVVRRADWSEVVRLVREEEAPTPSSRLGLSADASTVADNRRSEPARLSRLVRGDLDWVVLKALAKDRGRRYESAAALADDVARYLAHEPVSAGPPGRWYKARKFVRRHRAGVAAAAVVAATLVVGVVGTTWGLVRALDAERQAREQEGKTGAALAQVTEEQGRTLAALNRVTEEQGNTKAALAQVKTALAAEQKEWRRAERNATESRQVLDAVSGLAVSDLFARRPGNVSGPERAFFDRLIEFYEKFSATEGDDPRARTSRAEGYLRVGALCERIGDRARAEAAARKGIALWEALAAEYPDQHFPHLRLMQIRTLIGRSLVEQLKPRDAEPFLRAAVTDGESLPGRFPDEVNVVTELASARIEYGLALDNLRRPADALVQFLAAVKDCDRLAEMDLDGLRVVATATQNGARLSGDSPASRASAAALLKKSLSSRLEIRRRAPGDRENHIHLLNVYNILGQRAEEDDQPAAAAGHYRTGVELGEKLLAEYPGLPDARDAYAELCIGLALTVGRPDEADRLYQTALRIDAELVTHFADVPVYARHYAGNCNNYAIFLTNTGKAADAVAWLDKALPVLANLDAKTDGRGSERAFHRNTYANRAMAHERLAKWPEARADWAKAVELAPPGRPDIKVEVFHARAAARAGDAAAAAELGEGILRRYRPTPDLRADVALVFGRASAAAATPAAREAHAVRAVALLRLAARGPMPRLPRFLQTESDLDPLWSRPDFRALLAELGVAELAPAPRPTGGAPPR